MLTENGPSDKLINNVEYGHQYTEFLHQIGTGDYEFLLYHCNLRFVLWTTGEQQIHQLSWRDRTTNYFLSHTTNTNRYLEELNFCQKAKRIDKIRTLPVFL